LHSTVECFLEKKATGYKRLLSFIWDMVLSVT
jgi:hypothetical protein